MLLDFRKVNNGEIMERSKSINGILILIGVMFALLIVFSIFTIKGIQKVTKVDFKNSDNQIGVVEVKGVILDSQKAIKKLTKAEDDKKVKAIIIRIDSPGGAVGPTQEIYDEILRIDKIKPVYASFGKVAASGGYYIGAAARKIYSNRGSITGSIGVIMQFMDLSKLYKFLKLNPQILKSGEFKDIGNPTRQLTKKEKKLLDKTLANVHEQFRKDILKRRKDKIKGDIYKVSQGQIFSGEEAFKLGLVDRLSGLWAAGRDIHKELKLKGKFKKFKFIKLKKKFSVLDIAEAFDEGPESILNILGRFFKTPYFMYKY